MNKKMICCFPCSPTQATPIRSDHPSPDQVINHWLRKLEKQLHKTGAMPSFNITNEMGVDVDANDYTTVVPFKPSPQNHLGYRVNNDNDWGNRADDKAIFERKTKRPLGPNTAEKDHTTRKENHDAG